jgi:coproporphyrinogen III oxidase-like Fe-S oxidoreductase
VLRPMPPDARTAAEAAEKLEGALAAAISRVAFYHYALMPGCSLEWIGAMLDAR